MPTTPERHPDLPELHPVRQRLALEHVADRVRQRRHLTESGRDTVDPVGRQTQPVDEARLGAGQLSTGHIVGVRGEDRSGLCEQRLGGIVQDAVLLVGGQACQDARGGFRRSGLRAHDLLDVSRSGGRSTHRPRIGGPDI